MPKRLNFYVSCALHREPHHHGKEPRVSLQRPGAGSSGAREDAVRRDAGGARRLGLRSEGAAGETRHRHEAGDGAEVCGEDIKLMMRCLVYDNHLRKSFSWYPGIIIIIITIIDSDL